MSGDGLFHIDQEGRLVSMVVTPYEAEDILQKLLETHPDLLAGGQMTPAQPRRWLLIRREHGVPDHDAASGSRWSVDHLFVDQDAVPTLVEVKRSTDTRIRREVVGQMLDYAANGVRYWPIESLRSTFEDTQRGLGGDPEGAIRDLCGDPDVSAEEFFAGVGDNLRAGRIRMVFVADVIPDELRRITEFLNEQMTPAEVFAVEVKQYKAEGYPGTVIVPAVYGRTATASVKDASRRQRPDREELVRKSAPSTVQLLSLAEEVATELGLVLHQAPSGALLKTKSRNSVANVYLAPYDTLDVPLQPLRDRGWVADADALLGRLQAMTAKRLTEKNPSLPTADTVTHWKEMVAMFKEIVAMYEGSNE